MEKSFSQYEKVAARCKINYVLNGENYIYMSHKEMSEGNKGVEGLIREMFEMSIEKTFKENYDDEFNLCTQSLTNLDYIEPHGWWKLFLDKFMIYEHGRPGKYKGDTQASQWIIAKPFREEWTTLMSGKSMKFEEEIFTPLKSNKYKKMMQEYLGVQEFKPSVMINLSPNWKSNLGIQPKIDILKNTIQKYFDETFWFSEIQYVIERGGDPETAHVHAHAVCTINPEKLKSTRSYIRKNTNIKREIRKYFDKEVNCLNALKSHCEGALSQGAAIQIVSINKQEILEDKLDYLHEETKPPSHKNIPDDRFNGLLFTSKKCNP